MMIKIRVFFRAITSKEVILELIKLPHRTLFELIKFLREWIGSNNFYIVTGWLFLALVCYRLCTIIILLGG